MKIAIVGGGFAGLASAWYLLHHSQAGVSIDVFDPLPIGKGVSGLSSGLFHPYVGKSAKRTARAEEKLDAAHKLFGEAARAIGKGITLSTGMLRPAVTHEQIADFKKCANTYKETTFWDKRRCEKEVTGLTIPQSDGGGLFIKNALTLNVPLYLEGLFKACAMLGMRSIQKSISSLDDLKSYDRILLAMGAQLKSFCSLPLETIKGQTLILEWPHHLPPLPFSLNSEGYLIMRKGGTECLAGATFERNYTSEVIDPSFAISHITNKIVPFFPSIAQARVLSCHAGIRCATPRTHLPFLTQLNNKTWVIAGLGSKGLLYHGYLAHHLSLALLNDNPSLIPTELRLGIVKQ